MSPLDVFAPFSSSENDDSQGAFAAGSGSLFGTDFGAGIVFDLAIGRDTFGRDTSGGEIFFGADGTATSPASAFSLPLRERVSGRPGEMLFGDLSCLLIIR